MSTFYPSRFQMLAVLTAACSSGSSLRTHYVLEYAEYLHSDPALWRITVDYMYSCGEIGRGMADQILMRVPLRLQLPKDAAAAGEEAARIRSGQLVGVLKDVNETCYEHQREEVRRMVCRVGVLDRLERTRAVC